MASNNVHVIEPPPVQPVNVLYVEQMIPQPQPQPRLLNYLPLVCRVSVSLFIIFMITVICTILLGLYFPPKFPTLRVSNASIPRLMLSHDSIIAAECNITVLITNTNRHVSTEYSTMEVSLLYMSQRVSLAHIYTNSFVQPGMNSTRFETGFSMKDVHLGSDVMEALNKDVKGGSVRLGMRMEGIVSWNKFTARMHSMTVYCGNLVFRFNGSREVGVFESVGRECNLYLY